MSGARRAPSKWVGEMKRIVVIGTLALAAGCGLEGVFGNAAHSDFDRPASKLRGKAVWTGADAAQYYASDADGNAIAPFLTRYDKVANTYEMRLPSTKYLWIIAQARSGNMLLSNIVPQIGEETALDG